MFFGTFFQPSHITKRSNSLSSNFNTVKPRIMISEKARTKLSVPSVERAKPSLSLRVKNIPFMLVDYNERLRGSSSRAPFLLEQILHSLVRRILIIIKIIESLISQVIYIRFSPKLYLLNPHTPDRFAPSHAPYTKNYGSLLTQRFV